MSVPGRSFMYEVGYIDIYLVACCIHKDIHARQWSFTLHHLDMYSPYWSNVALQRGINHLSFLCLNKSIMVRFQTVSMPGTVICCIHIWVNLLKLLMNPFLPVYTFVTSAILCTLVTSFNIMFRFHYLFLLFRFLSFL